MSFFDDALDAAGSITGAVTGIPSAAAGAIDLASGIVGRAAGFVGDLTGVNHLPEQISGVVGRVRDAAEGVIDGVVDAAANPRRTIARAAEAARQGASRALAGARGLADGIADRANGMVNRATGRIGEFAQIVTSRVANGISNIAGRVGDIVTSGTTRASDLFTRAVGAGSGLLNRGIGVVGGLAERGIGLASEALQTAAHNIAENVAQRMRNATVNLTRMATRVAHGVGNLAHGAADMAGNFVDRYARGISRIAGGVSNIVTSVAGAIAPHLPGQLGNLLMRGAGFVGNVATGISGLATSGAGFIRQESAAAAAFVASRSGEALAFTESELAALRDELIGRTFTLADIASGRIQHIGERLTQRVHERVARLQTRIDGISSRIANRVQQVAGAVQRVVPALVSGVQQTTRSVEQRIEEGIQGGVNRVRGGFSTIVEGGRRVAHVGLGVAGRVVDRGIGIGQRVLDMGANVADRALGIGQRVFSGVAEIGRGIMGSVDRMTSFGLTARPNDGELTGPFFPGDPMVEPDQVGTLHGRSSPTSRESLVSGGAALFVNGIDTSLADHYRAAQRLANETGSPVVGVYNASAGMGTDLLQCAADKMFDRSGNPAVATLTRLIRSYGDARQPNGGMHIFAHSQGSLILSEALRQAQGSGVDLSGNDVTTFGNAAFTFPAGPQYHHYVHDDDAVSASVGTASYISRLLNTGIGRSIAPALLGPMADVRRDTVTLHHGGSMIAPHAVNAPDGNDYIGHLSQFRAQEARQMPLEANRPQHRRTGGAAAFAIARGVGTMASEAVESRYSAADRRIRSMPSIPGLAPNSIWNRIDSAFRSVGQGILSLGSSYGAARDSEYSSLSAVQRDGTGPEPDVDAGQIKSTLDRQGSIGFTPDMNVRQALGSVVGFDPAEARFHVNPAAEGMARELSAQAFTIGRDVYFGAGSYQPGTTSGLALMAHELTHVMQQQGGRAHKFTQQGGNEMEQDAQRTASRVLHDRGRPAGLYIERTVPEYTSETGLTEEDISRLDRIFGMALREADRRCGNQFARADLVDIAIELDLTKMSDAQAASIWANAIVDGVNLAVQQDVSSGRRQQVQRLHEPPFFFLDVPRPAADAAPLPGDDRMVILNLTVFGRHYGTVPYPEALSALRQKYALLCGQCEANYEGHVDFQRMREHHWIVGGISDTIGGVSMPPLSMWNTPALSLRAAHEALLARDVIRVAQHLHQAALEIRACERRIYEYREGTISGASTAVTGLEGVKIGAAVTVGILSAGTLSAPAALVVGAGYTATQTIAQQGTEVALGLRDQIDWAGIGFDFAFNLVIGRFMGPMSNNIAGRLLSNPAFRGMARAAMVRVVQDVLTGRSSAVLSLTARQIFDHARGSREAMTWEQYVHAVGEQLSDPRLYLLDVVSGMGGRRSGRHYAETHGQPVAAAPPGVSERAQGYLDIPAAPPPPAGAPQGQLPPSTEIAPPSRQLPAVAESTTTTPHTESPPAASPAADGATPPARAAEAAPTAPHPVETVPAVPVEHPAAPVPAGEPPVRASGAETPPAAPPPPLERVTGQRRGESAAQRRARVTEEVARQRATQESETVRPVDEHAPPVPGEPSVSPRHLEAVNRGGEGATAAAEQLIRRVGSFRQLREMATGQPPQLTPEGVAAVTRARARMQQRIQGEVQSMFPNLEFLAPGTTGFASDTDVTVRPRDYNQRSTPEQIAEGVRQAGEAVQEANRRAREAAGGREPDESLDTNYYSWTGADAPIQAPTGAGAQRQANARTVASLAEQHQAMTAEGWAEYRRSMLEQAGEGRTGPGVGEAQRAFEAENIAQLRRQLDAAEQMSNRLRTEREALATELRQQDASITEGGAQMRAREQLAARYRARLLEALARNPVDHAEVASLQSQITMIEPGAYASRAGVADVVSFQQTASARDTDLAVVRQQLASGEILESRAGSRRVMELNPVSGTRDLADSAGSSLAQFEAHAQHAPTSTAGALDLIKNVIKYSSRVMHADEATRAGAGEAPQELTRGYSRDEGPLAALEGVAGQQLGTISRYARGTILQMLGNAQQRPRALELIAAESAARGYGSNLQELASNYANLRLTWARRTTASIRVRATTQEAAHSGLSPVIIAPSLEPGNGSTEGGSR